MAIDAFTVLGTIGVLSYYGSPPWVYVLLFYTATRASRLDVAGDLAELQTTIRASMKAQGKNPYE